MVSPTTKEFRRNYESDSNIIRRNELICVATAVCLVDNVYLFFTGEGTSFSIFNALKNGTEI